VTKTLLRASLWSILVATVTYTGADPDLWGHVRFGLDILRDGAIARIDPYSFTADRPWINHEWAAEVITATLFRLGGNVGLIALKVAVVGLVLALLQASLRRDGVGEPMVRDAVAAIAIITLLEQTHHIRPQLFSILCFAALLFILTAADRDRWQPLVVVPPLFLFWANAHGGWLVGGLVLALWTIALAIDGAYTQARRCVIVGFVTLCATLVTPYGVGLWRFFYETVGFGRADIVEWQPVYALGWDAWARWLMVAAVATVAIALSRREERRLERVTIVFVLAAASFMVTRLLAFFALAVLFALAGPMARAYQRHRTARAAPATPMHVAGIAIMASVITVAAAGVAAVNLRNLFVDPRFTPAPGAVTFLKTQPAGRRILVWFDWGEYSIWHLAPRMQVSIDGRRETVYSASLQDRHLRFYYAASSGMTLPDELRADYVWIPRTLPAARQLATAPDWHVVYRDDTSIIFGRAGLEPVHAPVASLSTVHRTFPGP